MENKTSKIVLSSGRQFEGKALGAPVSMSGELVFTTAMVGYSEALTDPSYFGQILVFAYPLIGNYGLPMDRPDQMTRGFESRRIWASGVVMAVDSPDSYHWRGKLSLDRWLNEQNVPGISGVDTRDFIHQIREASSLFARLNPAAAVGARHPFGETDVPGSFFDPSAHNLLPHVSTRKPYTLGKGRVRIAAVDCGIKWNIIRSFTERDCELQILPWDTDFNKIDCDAWVISNGPGDPANTGNLIPRVAELLKQDRPILGICLGHQILALASGARTERLPAGHRSHNQPVLLSGTRQGFLTSQNHGYTVVADTLRKDWKPWFINLNDGSIEGIRHVSRPFQSVQFHPEAAGGPRDTAWIIDDFIKMVKSNAAAA